MHQFFKITIFCWVMPILSSVQTNWAGLPSEHLKIISSYLLADNVPDYDDVLFCICEKRKALSLERRIKDVEKQVVLKEEMKIDLSGPQPNFFFNCEMIYMVCRSWNRHWYSVRQALGGEWLDRNWHLLPLNSALSLKKATGVILNYVQLKLISENLEKSELLSLFPIRAYTADKFDLVPSAFIVKLIDKGSLFFSQNRKDLDSLSSYKKFYCSIFSPRFWTVVDDDRSTLYGPFRTMTDLFFLTAVGSIFLFPFLNSDELSEIKNNFSNFMCFYQTVLNFIQKAPKEKLYDEALFFHSQKIPNVTILTSFSGTEEALLSGINEFFFKVREFDKYWTDNDRCLFEKFEDVDHKLIFFYFKAMFNSFQLFSDFHDMGKGKPFGFSRIYEFILLAAGESIRHHLKSYKLPPFESFPKIDSPLNENNFLYKLFTFYKDDISSLCEYLRHPKDINKKIIELRFDVSYDQRPTMDELIINRFPCLSNWKNRFLENVTLKAEASVKTLSNSLKRKRDKDNNEDKSKSDNYT